MEIHPLLYFNHGNTPRIIGIAIGPTKAPNHVTTKSITFK